MVQPAFVSNSLTKVLKKTLSGIVTEFLYKVYPRPEVKSHQLELAHSILKDYCDPTMWNDTEGSTNCDTCGARICPRFPAAGAGSSGNQEIPLQVLTQLWVTWQKWFSMNLCTSELLTFCGSAYTTRRYTDGVWPFNLLPYGLPYVSCLVSTSYVSCLENSYLLP